jgi:hypothetical protein
MPAYKDNPRYSRPPVSRARAREVEEKAATAQQLTVLILGAFALLGFLLTM